MSKGVKKALGFVVAIAIPFVAAPIAAAIGAAGWLGSAAVGAGLGAANAALTGGNVAQGALFGGVGAGLSAGLNGAPMIGTATPAAGTAGVAAGTNPLVTGAQGVATRAGYIPTVAEAAAAAAGTVPIPAAAATQTATTFMEAVSQIPSTIASQLTDPTKLADITLRAGSMLASGLMTEDPMAGLAPEERQMVEMRKQELLAIQRTNEDLFNRQLALANDVMKEARQYNPQYFAEQEAKKQQLRGAELTQKATEDYSKGLGQTGREAALSAENRRIGLGVGRSMGGAFASGMQTAQATKDAKLQAASGLIPRSAPSGAYGSMLEMYKPYREAANSQQAGLQSTFTDFATRLFPPTAKPNIPTSFQT